VSIFHFPQVVLLRVESGIWWPVRHMAHSKRVVLIIESSRAGPKHSAFGWLLFVKPFFKTTYEDIKRFFE
jgi:hypothetical protein